MKELIFAPGPIRIPDPIKETFLEDPPYFTSKKFSHLIKEIQPKLRAIFCTSNPVLIGTGSGSLGMEMAVSNFFSPKDKVVVINTGKYGENWVDMCSRYGLIVTSIQPDLGRSFNDNDVRKIASIRDLKGILVTHTETTTAVLNDIKMLKGIHKGALIVVDAVSSLLTEELSANEYDVVISASQKAISIPAGLFFMSVSERATYFARSSSCPKFYFDVMNELHRLEKGITTFTPASNLYVALNEALNHILRIGMDVILRHTASLAKYTRLQLSHCFDIFSKNPCNAVTAVLCENSNGVIQRLYDNYGITIGGGVREMNDKLLRIMHFGWDMRERDLKYVIKHVSLMCNPYP